MALTIGVSVYLILQAGLFIGLAVFAWQKPTFRAGRVFALVMVALAWYCLGGMLEMAGQGLDWKLLCNNLIYPSVVVLGPLWLLLGIAYSDVRVKSPRLLAMALFFLPLLSLIIKYTDFWHHLFYANISLSGDSLLPLLRFQRGPWYWVMQAYTLATILAGDLLIIKVFAQATAMHRGQAFSMLAATVVPILILLLYLTVPFFQQFDINPPGFLLLTVCLSVGLYRFRLFESRPIAWRQIMESMPSAIFVLDTLQTVVDLNPSAKRLVGGLKYRRLITWQNLAETFPEIIQADLTGQAQSFDIRKPIAGGILRGKATIAPIMGQDGNLKGTSLVINFQGIEAIEYGDPQGLAAEMAGLTQKIMEGKFFLNPDLTLPLLADRLGQARNRLSYLINACRRENFNDFINGFRVDEACQLLRQPGANVLEVAFQAGFNSKTTFYDAFRKRMGQTPKSYQETQALPDECPER